MSVDLLVHLRRDRLPSIRAWNDALRKHGLKVVLDDSCDTATHEGYLPARVLGEDGGFEYLLTSPSDVQGGHDAEVLLSFRSDTELAAAAAAGAALADLAGGVMIDPQDDRRYPPANALEYARGCLQSIKQVLADNQKTGKTPAAWALLCRPTIAAAHPDYREKRRSKGKRLDFLRRDESGLIVSQNFLIDHYSKVHHGFALMFAEVDGRALYSPLRTRGWFDRRSISDHGSDHFAVAIPARERPRQAHHLYRTVFWGSDEAFLRHYPNPDDVPGFVAESVSYAERFLLPYYRRCLAQGAQNLAGLYSLARETFSDPARREDLLRQGVADLQIVRRCEQNELGAKTAPEAWSSYQKARAMALAAARSQAVPLEAILRVDVVDPATALHVAHHWPAVANLDPAVLRFAFLLRGADDFLAIAGELAGVAEIARGLGRWDLPPPDMQSEPDGGGFGARLKRFFGR